MERIVEQWGQVTHGQVGKVDSQQDEIGDRRLKQEPAIGPQLVTGAVSHQPDEQQVEWGAGEEAGVPVETAELLHPLQGAG